MMSSTNPKPKQQVSKKRRELEKKVVKVKMGANGDQKLKSKFPPSDSWSWRKYGQKPIKGTPYPRGYYKCTTSKGCLAKKQVERSKDDASIVIITYTTGHNHPGPGTQAHQQHKPIKAQPTSSDQAQPPPPPPPIVTKSGKDVSSVQNGHGEMEEEEKSANVVSLDNKCFQEETEEDKTVSWSELMMRLSSGGENEFFDELGELPHTSAPSSFTSFMKNYFFDERMLVPHP